MALIQTIDIPAGIGCSRQLTIDVPSEVPAGPVVLSFTPAEAAAKKPIRKPLSHYIGSCPGFLGADPVAYQRKLRNEWDE
jgi:hypothetical protein